MSPKPRDGAMYTRYIAAAGAAIVVLLLLLSGRGPRVVALHRNVRRGAPRRARTHGCAPRAACRPADARHAA